MKHVAVYFQSWSSQWVSDPSKMDLASLDQAVTMVYLSFANPNSDYKKGSKTLSGTGLDFSQDFNVVAGAIDLLKKRKVTVMLSVGGATYSFDVKKPPLGVIALASDLGCDGIDIDWEPTNGAAQDTEFPVLISAYKSNMWPGAKLSAAVFSTGAYGKDGSTYKGMNIKGLVERGSDLDWINLMAYDAGPPPPVGEYDPLGALTAYRLYYKGPIVFGVQPGPMGWGGHLISLQEVQRYINYVQSESVDNGLFIWSYQKNTVGSPSVKQILDLVKSITLVPAPTPAPVQTFTCTVCKTLYKISQ